MRDIPIKKLILTYRRREEEREREAEERREQKVRTRARMPPESCETFPLKN